MIELWLERLIIKDAYSLRMKEIHDELKLYFTSKKYNMTISQYKNSIYSISGIKGGLCPDLATYYEHERFYCNPTCKYVKTEPKRLKKYNFPVTI